MEATAIIVYRFSTYEGWYIEVSQASTKELALEAFRAHLKDVRWRNPDASFEIAYFTDKPVAVFNTAITTALMKIVRSRE